MEQFKKRKNWLLILPIVIGSLLLVFLLASVTKVLTMYRHLSISNMPTLQANEVVWVSRLPSIERGKFVAFKIFDSIMQSEQIMVKRCVGMPGDQLEMKNGVLFVNGKDFDNRLNLQQEYLLKSNDPYAYPFIDSLDRVDFRPQENGISIINIDKIKVAAIINELKEGDSLSYFPSDYPYNFFARKDYQGWHLDNFGPLKIPADSYFVMGDNRHQSQDSRFFGFLKREKITGVVLGK